MIDYRLLHRWCIALVIALSALFAFNYFLLHQPQTVDISAEHHEAVMEGHGHHGGEASLDRWEGSIQGIAYSERNHHIAGWFIMLMGLAELSHALRIPAIAWARLLFPGAMLLSGVFVMIWSDHEAWPIGALTFAQTFFGEDPEILQHKIYGLMALTVGTVELLRRFGQLSHAAWIAPLPLMAIVGGLLLFGHSHGAHPSAHKIAMHHMLMGTTAVTAGFSRFFSDWYCKPSDRTTMKWELLWTGLILFIGMELLIYSE
jgi:hypothetical protein